MPPLIYKSPLHEMVSTTATQLWNDSCAAAELAYAIEHGAVGATSNPTIVLQVLKKEWGRWEERLAELAAEHPTWTEEDLTWGIIEEIGVQAARLLAPVFEHTHGRAGRLSLQTHPAYYRNAERMVAQAVRFNRLAPNLQVKMPATAQGLLGLEEATYLGININATVSFTVAQALAVGEAVERGLKRRQAAGLPSDTLTPVCTIMVGRTDDWMHAVTQRDGIIVNPQYLHWAGVATFKRAYQLYRARGYRTRLLAAAYRHHLHWSEFIGGDVILTIPAEWQRLFNHSRVPVRPRMDEPVDPAIVEELYTRIPDFRLAYDEDGLAGAGFDHYGATVRTLRGFIASYHELVGVIREKCLLPNPDVKA